MYFKKDAKAYCDNFLENISYPTVLNVQNKLNTSKYFKQGSIEELEELLNYTWEEEKINKLLKKGVNIEVYLGEKDKIINSFKTLEFF